MAKQTTPSFIHEIPLKVSPGEIRILNTRLNVARQLYNACLGECLNRIKLIRESKKWQQAYKIHKSKNKKQSAIKNKLFKEAKESYQYSEYDLHSYAKVIASKCHIGSHLDSLAIQKIATRAYAASEEYFYGKRGKPRFKGADRFRSVEGKNNSSGIRFKDSKVIWNIKKGKKLELSLIYDLKDKYGVEAAALNSKVKYLRLIKKQCRGADRWYVQLVLSGTSYEKAKNKSKEAVVGLDLGPSTIAAVSNSSAILAGFCEELDIKQELLKKINRKLARSRRLTNPDNYNPDLTTKSGVHKWHRSNRYLKLKKQYARIHQEMSATRDKLHGTLINSLLRQGNIFKTEKLSYKGFQKNFGKSVEHRAPGKFIEKLKRKAERAGGEVIEFSTYSTKLSQTCHCGSVKKKSLSTRWHKCDCGVNTQRDLYSAYLAMHVSENSLDISQAEKSWPVAKPLLERAISRLKQQANRKTCFSSFGISQRQSLSHVRERSEQANAANVVEDAFCA